MKELTNKRGLLRICLIFIVLIMPWFNANYFDDITPAIPSQEDLSFYEINPCKVSLVEFLSKNKNSIYQDHFFFRFDDYSSIKCFGRVTGVTLVNNGFYISIGTNSLLNLLLQSMFWIIVISFIKKSEKKLTINKKYYFSSILLLSYFLVFIIYAEKRLYETKLYYFNLSSSVSRFILFILFFFIVKSLVDTALPRFHNLINYLPFIYLFISINSGFNLTFYSIIFMFFGLIAILNKEYNKNINKYYLLFSVFWIFNASGSFYFPPGKLRGFTSSNYGFNSVVSWSIIIFLLINGLLFFYRKNKSHLDINTLLRSFSISSITILSLGLIGSNFPIINFFNYYYFGEQKYGVKIQNPFAVNEWGEKIAWRGSYPSAESIGEFYGIAIILIIFSLFHLRKISLINSLGLISALFGLYFSNNRAVMILIFLAVLFLVYEKTNINRTIKIGMSISILGIIVFLIGFQNLKYSFAFTSDVLFAEALTYRLENTSSYLIYLNSSFEKNNIFYFFISFISYFAYLLNRAELWGIFSARYNPTFLEVLVGTGPLNFGQLYSEIKVGETKSFLLPHSSLLSLILFIGVIGVLLLFIFILYKIIKNKKRLNSYGYILLFYVFINMIKNDTINYFSSFALYSFIIYIILSIRNNSLFNFSDSEN